jgi:voltage-gated potassium channel
VAIIYNINRISSFIKQVKKIFPTQHLLFHFRKSLRGYFLLLVFLVALHTVAMIYIEYLYPWEAFWLTIVTLSTVGYGDISAQTQMGQIVTMLLLIIPGVIVISAILSRVIEIQTIKVNRKIFGKWNWKMDNHILIFNAPKNIEHFVTQPKQRRPRRVQW